jgi:hypothetical protein
MRLFGPVCDSSGPVSSDRHLRNFCAVLMLQLHRWGEITFCTPRIGGDLVLRVRACMRETLSPGDTVSGVGSKR